MNHTSNDILRSFVLDFNRVNNLLTLLDTDIPKRYATPYPPVDVVQVDNTWAIRMAVAGYSAKEISVSVEDEQLIVKSAKVEPTQLPEGAKVLQNGISKRAFERRWKLSEGMKITEVAMEDGILTIIVDQEIPENKKPKQFDITKKLSHTMQSKIAGLLQ
jgi:molecular chaperone IbpA